MGHSLMLLVRPAYKYGKQPQQNLDFEVLLGYLRRRGLPVQAVDAQLSGLDFRSLVSFIRNAQARLVYWHLRRRADFHSAATMVPLLKEASPQTLMVAGGDFATLYDIDILERLQALDCVIRGEPELALEALGKKVVQGEEWQDEQGITARHGRVTRNPPRKLLENLDVLGPAAEDLFEAGRLVRGQHVLFSRGCNSNCAYCGMQTPYRNEHPHRSEFWRSRSSTAIVDEIEHFHRAKGVSHFLFNSFVLFGYGETRQVGEVAGEILRRRLRISFSFVTHPGHLCRNRALLPLLKEAGLKGLTLGIDTGLDRVRRMFKLEFSRSDTLEALRLLHQEEVEFIPSFIFYDPFLEVEEIYENLAFLREIAPLFGHLEAPFGSIVEKHLIRTALEVRTDTPLYSLLLARGIAEPRDPLDGDPVVRFRHSAVGRIHKIHQLTDKVVGPGIRTMLQSPGATGHFPYLNHLSIELLEKILSTAEDDSLDEAEVASTASEWVVSRLRADLKEILKRL